MMRGNARDPFYDHGAFSSHKIENDWLIKLYRHFHLFQHLKYNNTKCALLNTNM